MGAFAHSGRATALSAGVLCVLLARADGLLVGGYPTNTSTFTHTFSATQSQSVSQSESITKSQSLSATETQSLSATETKSLTDSESLTATESLSATFTLSATDTYSLTHTFSLTATDTLSLTDTHSLSETHSLTDTLTESLPSNTNVTMSMGPKTFQEGQEFRIRLETAVDTQAGGGSTQQLVKALNSSASEFDVRMYTYSGSFGTTCSSYASGGTLLSKRTEYGFLSSENSAPLYVSTAYATFAAPSSTTSFVICFKQTKRHPTMFQATSNLDAWTLFVNEDHQYKFSGSASSVWYYLPEATVGQYAIVQLLSKQSRLNFTYGPSTCASSVSNCATSDNLKIVAKGEPCTHENQLFGRTYPGNNLVTTSTGAWSSTTYLQEGATAGGFGAFGTQYGNPVIDVWTAKGTYYSGNGQADKGNVTVNPEDANVMAHAYVYVRLPQTAADYDVCFSSVSERAEWASQATRWSSTQRVETQPMWRKLPRCTTQSACASNAANLHFAAVAEPVGWSMVDLSPGTWGEIVFDDSGAAQLSNKAAVSTVIVSAPVTTDTMPLVKTSTANYWAPTGGDYFRLVAATSFTETTTEGTAYVSGGVDLRTAAKGSSPSLGCWSRSLDTPSSTSAHGGYVEDAVQYPIGSRDLRGDPSDASADHEAAGAQAATFSTLWVPTANTRWNVCYRRTCTNEGATCAKYAGMRVLPFHKGGRGSTPHRWLNLNATYTPGLATAASHMLVPAQYEPLSEWGGSVYGYPPTATWYMNDTRTGTWGPMVIEKSNLTGEPMLDTRPWNLQRTYAAYDRVRDTQGSALNIVGSTKPCDYPSFAGQTGQGAWSKDGGMVECNNADAANREATQCQGSESDVIAATNAAFYVTVPDAGTSYKVCYRLRGFNWRQLTASATTGAWNDPTKPMPDATLERGDWVMPSTSYLTPDASALTTLSLSATEDRAGMEALFVVTDTTSSLAVAARGTCAGGCPNSGDVLRLVPSTQQCDIAPVRYQAEKALSDTHLSMLCRVAGSGTTATSGLLAQSGCSTAANTKTMCAGAVCTSTEVHLVEWALKTPDVYDDIVPHDETAYSRDTAAAVVTLPAYSTTAAKNMYKVCYKQMGTDNWAVFNETYEVKPASGLSLVSPTRVSENLVAGELKKFTLTTTLALPRDTTSGTNQIQFYAKLVKHTTSEQNNNCVNQPGSTEGEIYAAATTKFLLVPNTLNNSVEFYLTAPHAPGSYRLCVQLRRSAEDSVSWWRPGPNGQAGLWDYKVLDNGVRWYVTPGYQPTNQGLSIVRFVRCSPQSDGSCSRTLNQDVFDTDAGKDAAKIIAVSGHCHDNATLVTDWGASTHVGVEGGARTGISDLGPANGPSDVAEMRTVLPSVTSDAQVQYKVCVRTVMHHKDIGGVSGAARWVEVKQATGVTGQQSVTAATGESGFRTEAGLIKEWTLEAGLQPKKSLYTGPLTDTSSVALAGASTQYVSDPTTATTSATVANGFYFTAYSNAATTLQTGNMFKLVLAKKPEARLPSNPAAATAWGTQSSWTTLGVDCLSPAADSASNVGTCTDLDTTDQTAFCPQITGVVTTSTKIPAQFTVPLDPGAYLVCYKVSHTSLTTPKPWLMLASKTTVDYHLHSHPSFLEFAVSADKTNVTAYDVRTMEENSAQVSVSSWCGDGMTNGVNCAAQNGASGFTADLLTVVNDTQVCPAPKVAPAGSSTGPPHWFQLTRTANVSAAVKITWTATASALAMPPAKPATTGQYKVCVYKAGEATATQLATGSAQAVAKQGVVYQLYNRGESANGGGSGYWKDSSGTAGAPDHLTVTSTLSFNSTLRFMQYNSTVATSHGAAAVPDASVTTDGKVSRTPLVTSGTTVDYVVRVATASGAAVPFGSYPVEVRRCPAAGTFDGLVCATDTTEAPSAATKSFLVWNVGGACSQANGPMYGWEANGLKQFTQSGVVKLSLQYRSACPADEFGCGVRFVADASATSKLWSTSQWVNVAMHAPNMVSVDAEETEPAQAGTALSTAGCVGSSATTCYLKTCVHGLPCTLVFQARYQGPSEFAPTGTFKLGYSKSDYGVNYTNEAAPPAAATALLTDATAVMRADAAWEQGGSVTHTFTPMLKGGAMSGTIYLNASFGAKTATDYTRFAVTITKPTLASVELTAVAPLDVSMELTGSREPSPAFVAASTGTTMTAAAGSYVEALVPYKLTYMPKDASGTMLSKVWAALTGWTITGSVTGSSSSLVLRSVGAAEIFVTQPALLAAASMVAAPIGDQFSFETVFRVYVVDNTCSRFVTAGGCAVKFDFKHDTLSTVSASLVTPVRVPASTVEVTPSAATESVRAGITVTVKPGTYITAPSGATQIVYDEFHYGDAFALINGPAPTNGAMNRDEPMEGALMVQGSGASGCAYTGTTTTGTTTCKVAKYPMQKIGTSGWGAQWLMQPNKPCNRCEFTFHTTWGAGPESYALMAGGAQRGVQTLTWTSEVINLRCSAASTPLPVTVMSDATTSAYFPLTVTAGVGDTANAFYPRWWVFTDTNSSTDVTGGTGAHTLRQKGTTGTVLRAKMTTGALATFKDLAFDGPPPASGTTVDYSVKFHTVEKKYTSGTAAAVGSRPTSTAALSCTSTVSLQRVDVVTPAPGTPAPPAVTTVMALQEVTGVTSLCAAGTPASMCYDYTATVAELSAGALTVRVVFNNHTSGVTETTIDTTTVRNITVVPKGGFASSPTSALPWTYSATNSLWTSGAILLDSAYNPSSLPTIGANSYTYGHLNLVASRSRPDANVLASVKSGVGEVSLKYGTSVEKGPTRKAVFQVCESMWDSAALAEATTTSMCITINVWVTPGTVSKKTVLVAEHATHKIVRGQSSACGGGEAATFQVAPYYTWSGMTSATLRFWDYHTPLAYTLTTSNTQQMVLTSGTAAATKLVANNGVLTTDAVNHTRTTSALYVSFSFYGVEKVTTNTTVTVAAAVTGTTPASVASATSAMPYQWVDYTETFAKWDVSDAVSMDPECPTKRRLQTSTACYRTYGTGVPGLGWAYATNGATVNTPFPIETVVKNTAGSRAFSFTSGTLAKVSKRSWTGCNDGGTMAVYQMQGSALSATTKLVPGTLAQGWTLGTDNTVASKGGVATAWPVFSAECEACTLQLDLCFTGKTGATCLEASGSTDPSDAAPIFADRTKVTKPFAVKKPAMELVEVYNQTLPASGAITGSTVRTIQVGDTFKVLVESVQRFGTGNWAMNEAGSTRWGRAVWVKSVWSPTTGDETTSSEMQYGYGGFMHDGAARTGTGPPTAAEFAAGGMPQLGGSTGGTLEFFFTRPCHKCRVQLTFTLTPPATMATTHTAVTASFFMKTYSAASVPGSDLVYRVMTTGTRWLLGGVLPRAVRRRRPFSLTSVRVDEHGMPSRAGGADVSVSATVGRGNGYGSRIVVTSPVVAAGSASVKPEDGSATVRLFYTRACYTCGATFAGVTREFTVLTDATQIVAVPAYSEKEVVKVLATTADTASWTFELYAADDLGDRAYTVSGPTEYAFHHMYQTPAGGIGAATLSVSGSGVTAPNAVLTDTSKTLSVLTSGSPLLTVTSGTRVFNGIPQPALNSETGLVGTATVQLSGANGPAVGYQLSFAMGATSPATSFFGEKMRKPMVHFSVAASRMAVDRVLTTGTGCRSSMSEGSSACMFYAYAAGQMPGAASGDATWYLSALEKGEATAAVDCGTCATATVTPASKFMMGKAGFTLGLSSLSTGTTATTCACTVTVTPPATLVNATAQAFSVTYTKTTLDLWRWTTSDTLTVSGSGTATHTAFSVANRSVDLGLRAYDSTMTYSGLGGLTWAAASVSVASTEMVPAGCFACLSSLTASDGTTRCAVTVTQGGDAAAVRGVFANVGTCELRSGAFGGLPTSAGVAKNPNSGLRMTVETPTGLKIVGAANEGDMLNRPNFTKLWGRTHGGMRAAVAGVGSSLSVSVVDASGALVAGDNHMSVTLTGSRTGTNLTGQTQWTQTVTARNGVAMFMLMTNETTRTSDCEAMTALTATDTCMHAGWSFDVSATAPVSTTGAPGVSSVFTNGMQGVGPLYYVRRAHKVVAFADTALPCKPAAAALGANETAPPPPPYWMPQPPECPAVTPGTPAASVGLLNKAALGMVPIGLGGASGPGMHAGRSMTGMRHPANAGYGFNFSMAVMAVGPDGITVSHPEDVGSKAELIFRALAVPCRNIDADTAATQKTCIFGGSCDYGLTLATLTPCNPSLSSGWTLRQATKIKLVGGMAQLKDVSYGNVGFSRPGLTRFMLTTTHFNHGPALGWTSTNPNNMFAPPDDLSLFEINMQQAAAVRPANATGWTCTASNACTSTTGFSVQAGTEANRRSFGLSFAVVDVMGDVVAADSNSTLAIGGRCVKQVNGTVASFFGSVMANGQVELVTLPKFQVYRGVALIENLTVMGPCDAMEVTVTCASGPTDVKGSCNSKTMTFTFPVTGEPILVTAPPPVIVVSGLALASFTTATDASAFVASLNVADAQEKMLALLNSANPVWKRGNARTCAHTHTRARTTGGLVCGADADVHPRRRCDHLGRGPHERVDLHGHAGHAGAADGRAGDRRARHERACERILDPDAGGVPRVLHACGAGGEGRVRGEDVGDGGHGGAVDAGGEHDHGRPGVAFVGAAGAHGGADDVAVRDGHEQRRVGGGPADVDPDGGSDHRARDERADAGAAGDAEPAGDELAAHGRADACAGDADSPQRWRRVAGRAEHADNGGVRGGRGAAAAVIGGEGRQTCDTFYCTQRHAHAHT